MPGVLLTMLLTVVVAWIVFSGGNYRSREANREGGKEGAPSPKLNRSSTGTWLKLLPRLSENLALRQRVSIWIFSEIKP